MRVLLKAFVICILGCILATSARAEDDNSAKQTIQKLVTSDSHLSVEAWRAISPNAAKIIITLFEETKSSAFKVKLVATLSNYDDDGTNVFLKDQTLKNDSPEVRRMAIRSLAISQGLNQKNFLQRFLKSPDPETRFETAKAFQNMHDVDAEKILSEYLKHEKTQWIVKKLKFSDSN